MEEINNKIRELNKKGIPAIFFVTGNNSAGKTTLVKELLKNLEFYQSVNLGIISKMLRFFRPDIPVSQLENFDNNEATLIFKKAIDFMVDSYVNTGVNALFDGVQADTKYLLKNPNVLGGIILEVKRSKIFERGEYPTTHFKRSVKKHGFKAITYEENDKFKLIDNNGNIQETLKKVEKHLNNLLDKKLKQHES